MQRRFQIRRDMEISFKEQETLSPLAKALKNCYFEYAGRQHVGAHLPETWEAIAAKARKQDPGLQWLSSELRKIQEYLSTAEPKKDIDPALAAQFQRGLREMLDFVIQKCECEIEWQQLRQFVGGALPDLPEHGSEIVLSKKGEKS